MFLGRWNHIEVAAKEFFTGGEAGGAGGEDGQLRAQVRGTGAWGRPVCIDAASWPAPGHLADEQSFPGGWERRLVCGVTGGSRQSRLAAAGRNLPGISAMRPAHRLLFAPHTHAQLRPFSGAHHHHQQQHPRAPQAALLREVRTLTTLTMHPNVVRFCGVCLRPPLVVTEYYSNGSLYQMLARARKQLESGGGGQKVGRRAGFWRRRGARLVGRAFVRGRGPGAVRGLADLGGPVKERVCWGTPHGRGGGHNIRLARAR